MNMHINQSIINTDIHQCNRNHPLD